MNETISCIITTYKRTPFYIIRAIKSIQNQTYNDIEIIIVDDNPNGNPYSKDLQQCLLDFPKIKYIKQDGNKGACAARNLGIERAAGKYVAFLDDDDEWLPEKIALQKSEFNKTNSSDLGMVFCNGYTVYADNPNKTELYNPTFENSNPTYEDMLYADFIGSTSQPLILKDAIVKVGMFDETFPARQDYEMWIRISKEYKIKGINQPLFLHHQHEGEQITSNGNRALKGYLKIYKKYKKDYKKHKRLFASIMDRIFMVAEKTDKKIWYFYRLKYKIYRLLHI